ncbi:MAG: response regulator [Leptospiraceae bacterium]|nr:response regulator [Leptospiraceae bacterium]
MGLSITKGLVHLLKGEIQVTSKPKTGTCFTITLPTEIAYYGETKNESEKEEFFDISILNGKKFLIAGDDPLSAKLLEDMVQIPDIMDIETSIVKNGWEVIEILKENHFDLILMDLSMTELDGIETIKRIREPGNSIPIIAQTAYVMGNEKDKCLEFGFSEYISKPYLYEDMIFLIVKMLKKHIS